MRTPEELTKMLKKIGFPRKVIDDYLLEFWELTIEIKAQEVEFWGNYFVKSGEHYRKWGVGQHKALGQK